MAIMKNYILASVSMLLVWTCPAAPAKPAKPPVAAAVPTTRADTAPEIAKSLFIIPATPSEGRNPFFAPSRATPPPPVRVNPTNAVDTSGIVLNGLTGPPKRSAMINNRTFELGEEADIRLPGGAKLLIKCAEIKDDSATIIYNGQRRELRLRFGI